MNASGIYGGVLILMAFWGVNALRKPARSGGRWSWRRRQIVLVDALYVLSCAGCGLALWAGRFRSWMAAPIGLSYLLMIPLPCYFEWVDRSIWIRAPRNLAFLILAAFLFSIALGWVPLPSLGLG